MTPATDRDKAFLEVLHKNLNIPETYAQDRGAPMFSEAAELIKIDCDYDMRGLFLLPAACKAWLAMQAQAKKEEVVLQSCSGFRSYFDQVRLIQNAFAKGRTPEDVFSLLAAPGFSEHHTGCAIDITTPGVVPVEEDFEDTDAFRWLAKHAGEYDFILSYPRDNPFGFVYEPWHWAWHGA